MKNIFKTFFLVVTFFTTLNFGNAQFDISVTSSFNPTLIAPGENTTLSLNFSNISVQSPFTIPAGKTAVQVQVPVDYYVITGAPSGIGATLFSWADLGNGIWLGTSIVDIPIAGGGPIEFNVLGVQNTPGGNPAFTPITGFIISPYSDVNPSNNVPQSGLLVPVKLSSFDVKSSDCSQVLLGWITESENSNKGFELERSLDARNFEKIGFIEPAEAGADGKYHYFFDDNTIENDKGQKRYFYRLKQVDFDGRINVVGSVISVDLDCREDFFAEVYPIPAYDKLTYKLTNNYLGQDIDIMIYSSAGKLVHKSKVENVSLLENQIDVSKMQVGIYRITFVSKLGIREYKFMKMR